MDLKADLTQLRSLPKEEIAKRVASIVRQVVEDLFPDTDEKRIPIEISARHLHITQKDLETLFGSGYQLTNMKDLNQPGEFAANETVAIIGPNRRVFEKVRILGPTRPITQVELSYSDGIYLGMNLPHRLSGNIEGSAPVTLVGPKGALHLKEGAIRAMRHIHMSPEQAAKWGIVQGQKVDLRTPSDRSVVFNDVVVRIVEDLNLTMHVDTDEANAAGLDPRGAYGVIV